MAVNRKLFFKEASEIAEAFNQLNDSNEYSIPNIEIHTILSDNNDGKGYQIVSRALVRNIQTNEYIYFVDLIGSSEEALSELKNKILIELKEKDINKFKKIVFKLN